MPHPSFRFLPTALLPLVVVAILAFPCQAQPNAADIRPSHATLELPRVVPAFVDGQAVEIMLCGIPGSNGGAGQVGLTVTNDGSSGPFILPVLDVLFDDEEDTVVVSVSRLQWTGLTPFPTDCGPWSYTVTLDPDAVQPRSFLTLGRAADWATSASFAGPLEAAVVLHFVGEDGQGRDIPAALRLDLTGRWKVIEDTSAESESNLVLTAETATAVFLNPS